MIRLSMLFLILLASVWLGVYLYHDPGYVLITFHGWSIEATLWVAIGIILLAVYLCHLILLLFKTIRQTPANFRKWRITRRCRKAHNKTQQGLIEFTEGYWSQAKSHLITALPYAELPLLNYLTAARAAQKLGNIELRDYYLYQAQDSIPNARIAIGLTQSKLQLENKQWQEALTTLQHIQQLNPKHPYVLKLLLELYTQTEAWAQLIQLLPYLKRYNVLSRHELDSVTQNVYIKIMLYMVHKAEWDKLDQLITNLPRYLRYNHELMAIYCKNLISRHQYAAAEIILRRCLQKSFNESLINLYGQLQLDKKPLVFAESFLGKHRLSADLYLCLGRLSLNNHLWGKAKNYLEKSIYLKPASVAYTVLGKLLEQLQDQTGACEAYRKALMFDTPPDAL